MCSVLQSGVDVFTLKHFVGHPVEDVKNEKANWKDGPRYGINPLGTVHKHLADVIAVIHHGNRWRCGVYCGTFQSCTIYSLEAVTQSITMEVKPMALLSQLFLLEEEDKCFI